MPKDNTHIIFQQTSSFSLFFALLVPCFHFNSTHCLPLWPPPPTYDPPRGTQKCKCFIRSDSSYIQWFISFPCPLAPFPPPPISSAFLPPSFTFLSLVAALGATSLTFGMPCFYAPCLTIGSHHIDLMTNEPNRTLHILQVSLTDGYQIS